MIQINHHSSELTYQYAIYLKKVVKKIGFKGYYNLLKR